MATFEIYREDVRWFGWRLRADDGQVLATLGSYMLYGHVLSDIAAVREQAAGAAVREQAAGAAIVDLTGE